MTHKTQFLTFIIMLTIFAMVLSGCASAVTTPVITLPPTGLPNTGQTAATSPTQAASSTAAVSLTQTAPTTTAATPAPLLLPSPTPTTALQAFPIEISKNTSLGKILVTGGVTLYAFTQDKPGVSNCYDQCTAKWHPLLLPAGSIPIASGGVSGVLSTIQRKDGTIQITVNNMPVYTFYKDVKKGLVDGQGFGGVWYVLDPSGHLVKKGLHTAKPHPTTTPVPMPMPQPMPRPGY